MINFEDLFDWEKESDLQYLALLNGKHIDYEWEQWEEEQNKLPAKIEVINPLETILNVEESNTLSL